MAKTTNFVNSCAMGTLMTRNYRIIKLSGVGSCCSMRLGCSHLTSANVTGRSVRGSVLLPDTGCPSCHFVGVSLASHRKLAGLFGSRRFSVIIGLTTRTNIHCSVRGPCTCVRSGIINFLGLLRYYQRCPMGRLICTDSDDVCKLGSGIPCTRASGTSSPIDLCTTAGGSGRLVTRTCDGLCDVPAANIHFFAMCKP